MPRAIALLLLCCCALAARAQNLNACDTLRVTGFDDDCLLDPCASDCRLRASDANGKWTRLEGVGEQLMMVDAPAGTCSPKLPVYYKHIASANITLFLYYDAAYFRSVLTPGQTGGWAIGTSIGTKCNDNFGICTYGQVPSACCTTGFPHQTNPENRLHSYCQPFLMRKMWGMKVHRRDRPLPQDARGRWYLRTQPSCDCFCKFGGCLACSHTRMTTSRENRNIKIRCASNPDRRATEPELETQGCLLLEPEYYPQATCRRDLCAGCCPFCNDPDYCLVRKSFWPDFFNPSIAECDHVQTSCACPPEGNPVIGSAGNDRAA